MITPTKEDLIELRIQRMLDIVAEKKCKSCMLYYSEAGSLSCCIIQSCIQYATNEYITREKTQNDPFIVKLYTNVENIIANCPCLNCLFVQRCGISDVCTDWNVYVDKINARFLYMEEDGSNEKASECK